ncbi:hypothetical protein BH11GEM1_BH11GEM1_33030 [soil metagenome]
MMTLCLSAAPGTTAAQVPTQLDLGGRTQVGGEAERYLRAVQLSGPTPASPWTLQPFAPDVERGVVPPGPHPWSARFTPADSLPHVRLLRPAVTLIGNSAFPFQESVGPIWAGRGATVAAQGGFAAKWGRLEVQFAPIAFFAQNLDFALAPNTLSGDARFADARYPCCIDYPQRFGSTSYGRLDPGQSSVTLSLPVVSLGASSESQRWGPAHEFPLVLGRGAGGFPHAFIGTNSPVNFGLFRLQARYIAGPLDQSSYSQAAVGHEHRIASALVLAASPRGFDGLEVGFERFFESTNAASRQQLLRPFSLGNLAGAQGDTVDANIPNENQIASAFFRWALPTGGVELYGEWYREDYPGDRRKLALKPDDLSTFELGLQRVLVATPLHRRLVRFEIVNGELSHQERGSRGGGYPEPPYIHSEVLQGHTEHGLLLGSPEAYGGAGWRLAVDDYTPSGRVTLGLERFLRFDAVVGQPSDAPDIHPDVLYGVRAELLRFAGARDYSITVVPALDLNRNLERGNDVFNLHVALTVHGW